MRPLRLGAVSYLNVRPLVYGLDEKRTAEGTSAQVMPASTVVASVRFDVPSVCAQLLADGTIDLGMVPSITWLDRPGDRIVPGVCIGSSGSVASVALFSRRPIRDVRTIALDTSSRTSAVLTRILCARHFHIEPTFVPHGPDLPAMLAVADAALLIGDPALFIDHRAIGAEKIDLGEAWRDMTGLPFVWAFWSGREGAVDRSGVAMLQAVRDAGVASSDAVADAYCAGRAPDQATARRYLREHMRYHLDAAMVRGLTAYYREAFELGFVARIDTPVFFGG